MTEGPGVGERFFEIDQITKKAAKAALFVIWILCSDV